MMKRGGANDKSINGSEFLQPITGDESFQEIHSHELSADSNSLATQSQSSMSGVSSQSSRNLVSNLFNTIRQRRVPATNSTTVTATASYTPNNNNSEKDNVSIGSNSSSTSSYFKSKYLSDGLNSISFGKSVSAASKTVGFISLFINLYNIYYIKTLKYAYKFSFKKGSAVKFPSVSDDIRF